MRTTGEICPESISVRSEQGSANRVKPPAVPLSPVRLATPPSPVRDSTGPSPGKAVTLIEKGGKSTETKNDFERFGALTDMQGVIQGSLVDGLVVSKSPGYAGSDDMLLVRVWNVTSRPIVIHSGSAVTCIELVPKQTSQAQPCRKVSVRQSAVTVEKKLPPALEDLLLRAQVDTDEQRQAVRELLWEFQDAFSCHGEIGRCDLVEMEIDTGDHPPIKMAARRVPIHQQQVVDDCMDDMIALDAIEPAPESAWAFPVNLIPKKRTGGATDSWRFAIDYRN